MSRKSPAGGTGASAVPPVTLLRSEDLLTLKFSFVNLKMGERAGAKFLTPAAGKQPAFLLVEFPPQSFAEEAVVEGAGGALEANELPEDISHLSADEAHPDLPFAKCRAAGPSVLVFKVPPGTTIPYTPEGLLDWKKLALHTAKSSLDLADPTRLEAPYGLFIRPAASAGWAHSPRAVTKNDRTELWHTRLGTKVTTAGGTEVGEGHVFEKSVSVVGAVEGNDAGFSTPLSEANRQDIAEKALDVQVRQLMLSPLGAWIDLRAEWAEQASTGSWQHRATMGRDHYVRVATPGYLYPFGHRALKVEITERKFSAFNPAEKNPKVGAWLVRRTFVVVLEQEKDYAATAQTEAGRQMPFKRVRVATAVTPDLDTGDSSGFFLIKVGPDPFPFPLTATDSDGRVSDFKAALFFVEADAAAALAPLMNKDAKSNPLKAAYKPFDAVEMPGSKVTFARAQTDKSGVTAFETSRLVFDAVAAPAAGAVPPFHPVVGQATIRLPAVEQLTGQTKSVEMTYAAGYLKDGQAEVFAQLVVPLPVSLPTGKSGGLVKPELAVRGLSRERGAVAPAGEASFDTGVFGGTKILGGMSLLSILPTSLPAARSPQFKTQTFYKGGVPAQGVERVETVFEWKLSGPAEIVSKDAFASTTTTALSLSSTTTTRPDDAGDPDYRVSGALRNFGIRLADIIEVQFEELTFDAAKNKKLDFSAVLKKQGGGVAFLGPLKFLNALAAVLSQLPEGFKDPPFLDVTAGGVTAGFTQGLPPVTLGVMSLDNVSFSAALSLPFSGDLPLRARFAFSERQRPFHLTVYGIAGGGFLGVAVGLDGVETIEAALEFGGSLTLNLGVAAGVAYVMAGIYFKAELKPGADEIAVTGYLRCGGEFEVLGLVCVSAEFYMGLTYEASANKIWGQAKLLVEVEVLGFSESVELEVRREFTNSARFTFEEIMPDEKNARTGLTPWEEYCEAFAA